MNNERAKKVTPAWNDVKARLVEFDQVHILALLHDLYASSKESQLFLQTRLGLGSDILKPYKQTISRNLWPNFSRGECISISATKRAISDYKKAIGKPEELAELMTYYCEQAAGFSHDVGYDDDAYFSSLVNMFAQVLKIAAHLPKEQRDNYLKRLSEVTNISNNLGDCIGSVMTDLLEDYQFDA
jgi:hypothetical protein